MYKKRTGHCKTAKPCSLLKTQAIYTEKASTATVIAIRVHTKISADLCDILRLL